MMRFGYTINALFFASLVALSLHPEGLITRIFSMSWLRFFGRYSYGLYILHSVLPAFYALRMAAFIAAVTPNLTLRNGLQCLGEFTVTVVASLLTYHLLEQPFLRMKRFFPNFRVSRLQSARWIFRFPRLSLPPCVFSIGATYLGFLKRRLSRIPL